MSSLTPKSPNKKPLTQLGFQNYNPEQVGLLYFS